jgi:hypothetical protein
MITTGRPSFPCANALYTSPRRGKSGGVSLPIRLFLEAASQTRRDTVYPLTFLKTLCICISLVVTCCLKIELPAFFVLDPPFQYGFKSRTAVLAHAVQGRSQLTPNCGAHSHFSCAFSCAHLWHELCVDLCFSVNWKGRLTYANGKVKAILDHFTLRARKLQRPRPTPNSKMTNDDDK